MSASGVRILFSTGEVSGDIIGALLARELKARAPNIGLWGVGGERMKEAGVSILQDTNALGSAGITEPLVTLPGVFKTFAAIRDEVRRERPAAAVLIGHEGFNLVLARWLRRHGILTIAYFPPQIWIWREAARLIATCYDWILTSFMEEEDVYRQAGGRTVFVGHYLLDLLQEVSLAEKNAAKQALGLAGSRKVVAVLPGSRRQEVAMLGPVLLDAVTLLASRDPSLQFVLPLADPCLEEEIIRMVRQRRLEGWIHLTRDSEMSLAAAELALLCSGTATLEAALMGIPMIILYRVSPVTISFVRFLVRVKLMDSEIAGLPNRLAGASITPEFRQAEATASNLSEAASSLLRDEERQRQMKQELRLLGAKLGEKGAPKRAAQIILQILSTVPQK
jgi:lipid-A-disaccharide synthase